MSGPGAAADAEPVGSVAEEAFKLFRAMTTAPAAADPADHTQHSDHTGSPDHTVSSDHVCSTSWCPVCQVVGLVRDHPEVVASVTTSAALLARSLRDLVDTALHSPQEKQ